MNKYILSDDAQLDLEEIITHIAKDSKKYSKIVAAKFNEYFQMLSEMPNIGHVRDDLTSVDVKFIQIYSYLIIYDYKSKPIVITRILSAYRNIENIIN